ncbi:MAG: glycosyltransferase family 39 protein, partial [Dehalococcoidia bacterium]|nr:glycosyltransferase family 39 protein [Dehalococcoidia bacterium]
MLAQDTVPLGGDPLWYYTVARNVAEGHGYVIDHDDKGLPVPGPGEPTAFWPPGYPLALAGVYSISGPTELPGRMFNAALGVLAIPLVFLIGRAIFETRTGLWGAAVFVLLPEPIMFSSLLMSEPLFTVLFLAALLVMVRQPRVRHAPAASALFGLLAGAAILTRGPGLLLLPAAALF